MSKLTSIIDLDKTEVDPNFPGSTRYMIEGKLECIDCKEWKFTEDFHKHKGKPFKCNVYCKDCANNRARKNHKENRAPGTEGQALYRRSMRQFYYKRVYGITLEEYETMLESQDNKCAICRKSIGYAEGPAKAHLDHNHTTGKIREILCVCCNKGIGYLQEDKTILDSAIKYLEKHNE